MRSSVLQTCRKENSSQVVVSDLLVVDSLNLELWGRVGFLSLCIDFQTKSLRRPFASIKRHFGNKIYYFFYSEKIQKKKHNEAIERRWRRRFFTEKRGKSGAVKVVVVERVTMALVDHVPSSFYFLVSRPFVSWKHVPLVCCIFRPASSLRAEEEFIMRDE